jgi:hypothetical protein
MVVEALPNKALQPTREKARATERHHYPSWSDPE